MKLLSHFLSELKRLFTPQFLSSDYTVGTSASGAAIKHSGIDPRMPLAAQVSVTRKTRRKILRALAAERRAQTKYGVEASRKMARADRKSSRLVRAFIGARYKRVAIGSIVERRMVTMSARYGRLFRTVKFKAMRHGKLVAA